MSEELLPEHWVTACLRDVVSKLVDGSHNPPEKRASGFPMLSAINVFDNQIAFSTYRLIDPDAFVAEDRRTSVQPGDVLLTIVGAIGRAAVVPPGCRQFTLQRSVAVLSPIRVNSKFLMYQLESPRLSRYLQDNARGTAQKGIYLKKLGEAQIWLPPRAEQCRIVGKIEELLSELDKGVENLITARDQLQAYRQALLKAAVEGRLTADWRAANLDKLDDAKTVLAHIRHGRGPSRNPDLNTRALKKLPEGWAWAMVQEVGEVQLGRQRAPQHHSGDHLRPYLRVANVLENALDLSDVKEMNFTPEEYETFALRDGDVLLNEGQAPALLGRPAIYRGQIPGCCFQKTLLRFRPGLAISSEFALIVFRHYMRSGRFMKESRITTNIGHLTQVRFVVMEFPVPPRAEQDEIVKRFREGEALDLDAEIEIALARITTLRQSILNKAFTGELVAQDAADEPASVMLERIRAEQEAGSSGRKKNNKNGKKEAA